MRNREVLKVEVGTLTWWHLHNTPRVTVTTQRHGLSLGASDWRGSMFAQLCNPFVDISKTSGYPQPYVSAEKALFRVSRSKAFRLEWWTISNLLFALLCCTFGIYNGTKCNFFGYRWVSWIAEPNGTIDKTWTCQITAHRIHFICQFLSFFAKIITAHYRTLFSS